MTFEKLTTAVAALRSWEAPATSGSDGMDLIASAGYETGCTALILPKEALGEEFFRLSTGLAGEVLQKFVIYQMKLAVVGDFSQYTGKPLRDFLRESNRGSSIFFVRTEEEALRKLTEV